MNNLNISVDFMKLRKEIKYNEWKRKNKDHIENLYGIFKNNFIDIIELTNNEWDSEEYKERFREYIYKNKS